MFSAYFSERLRSAAGMPGACFFMEPLRTSGLAAAWGLVAASSSPAVTGLVLVALCGEQG
jgi:hypothetical protein